MNDNLIKTARSLAHRVKQDDAVLARARKLNSRRVVRCARVAFDEPEVLNEYVVFMRGETRMIHHEIEVHAANLRAARATGRKLAAALGYNYVTTKLPE